MPDKVFVRNISDALWRRTKALAARRGITLSEAVSEALLAWVEQPATPAAADSVAENGPEYGSVAGALELLRAEATQQGVEPETLFELAVARFLAQRVLGTAGSLVDATDGAYRIGAPQLRQVLDEDANVGP